MFMLIDKEKDTLIMKSEDFEIKELSLYKQVKTHKNKEELIKEIDEFLKEE